MAILHYTESGRGEPLILLHSGGMSGVEWIPQIPLFARNFRVIVPIIWVTGAARWWPNG